MQAPVGAVRDPYINPGVGGFCWLGDILFAPRLTRIDGTRHRKSGWFRRTGSRLVSGLRLAWERGGGSHSFLMSLPTTSPQPVLFHSRGKEVGEKPR